MSLCALRLDVHGPPGLYFFPWGELENLLTTVRLKVRSYHDASNVSGT
jgi:hypothetical protein